MLNGWEKSIDFLGLTVGINYERNTAQEKKEAYNCDIMYTTNNELGFDYLRDNMVVKSKIKEFKDHLIS